MEFETGRKFLIEKGYGLAGAGVRSIGSDGGREVLHAKAPASGIPQDGDRSDGDRIVQRTSIRSTTPPLAHGCLHTTPPNRHSSHPPSFELTKLEWARKRSVPPYRAP